MGNILTSQGLRLELAEILPSFSRKILLISALEFGFAAHVDVKTTEERRGEQDDEGQKEAEKITHGRKVGWKGRNRETKVIRIWIPDLPARGGRRRIHRNHPGMG